MDFVLLNTFEDLPPNKPFCALQCKPRHVDSEDCPIVFGQAYSQVNLDRITVLIYNIGGHSGFLSSFLASDTVRFNRIAFTTL